MATLRASDLSMVAQLEQQFIDKRLNALMEETALGPGQENVA